MASTSSPSSPAVWWKARWNRGLHRRWIAHSTPPAWLADCHHGSSAVARVAERLQNARNKVANGTPVLGLDGSTAASPAPSGGWRCRRRHHARTSCTAARTRAPAGDHHHPTWRWHGRWRCRALPRLTAKTLLARALNKPKATANSATRPAPISMKSSTRWTQRWPQAARTVG